MAVFVYSQSVNYKKADGNSHFNCLNGVTISSYWLYSKPQCLQI